MSGIRCSRCGKKNHHNRRTCGKPSPQVLPTAPRTTFPTSPQRIGPASHLTRMMAMMSAQDTDWTEEEISTWWRLSGGSAEDSLSELEHNRPWSGCRAQDALREDFLAFTRTIPAEVTESPSFASFLLKRPIYLQIVYVGVLRCPENAIRVLARDGNTFVKLAILTKTRPASSICTTLLNDPDPEVRRAAVKEHPGLPDEHYDALFEEDEHDEETRKAAVARDDLPSRALQRFALDSAAGVRRIISRRVDCPPATVMMLADDSDVIVREHIAMRADLTEETVEVLLRDTSVKVLKRVALNQSIDTGLLKDALEGKPKPVRLALAQRIKRHGESGRNPK